MISFFALVVAFGLLMTLIDVVMKYSSVAPWRYPFDWRNPFIAVVGVIGAVCVHYLP